MKKNRLTLLRRPWRLPAAPVHAVPVPDPARGVPSAQARTRNRVFGPFTPYQPRAAQMRNRLSAAAL